MPFDHSLANNADQCLTGSALANRNAQGLLRCARLLASAQEKGAATSLAVLASEEAIKSIALLVAAISPSEFDSLLQQLSRHKSKHDAIKAMQLIAAPMEFISQCMLDWEHQNNLDPTRVSKRPWDDIIPKFEQWAKDAVSDPASSLALSMAWWESANSTKNAGLYVDFVEGKWISPDSTVGNLLSSALDNAESIVNRSSHLLEVPFEELVADFRKLNELKARRTSKTSATNKSTLNAQ